MQSTQIVRWFVYYGLWTVDAVAMATRRDDAAIIYVNPSLLRKVFIVSKYSIFTM